MAKVTLLPHGPGRINIAGYMFEKGITHENVDYDTGRALQQDERKRFQVEFLPEEITQGFKPEAVPDAEVDVTPKKPKGRAEITAAILEAIDQLDLDDETNFTKDGRPDARALTAVLKWQVTSEDRDEALRVTAEAAARATEQKPRGNIRIVKKAPTNEPVDTGAAAEQPGEGGAEPESEPGNEGIDPSTEGGVTVE